MLCKLAIDRFCVIKIAQQKYLHTNEIWGQLYLVHSLAHSSLLPHMASTVQCKLTHLCTVLLEILPKVTFPVLYTIHKVLGWGLGALLFGWSWDLFVGFVLFIMWRASPMRLPAGRRGGTIQSLAEIAQLKFWTVVIHHMFIYATDSYRAHVKPCTRTKEIAKAFMKRQRCMWTNAGRE